jgi:hypothetical protein
MCPVCGLKAPAGYDNAPQDNYADARESTVGELERVHATLKSTDSTLREIHSTLKDKGSSGDAWGSVMGLCSYLPDRQLAWFQAGSIY